MLRICNPAVTDITGIRVILLRNKSTRPCNNVTLFNAYPPRRWLVSFRHETQYLPQKRGECALRCRHVYEDLFRVYPSITGIVKMIQFNSRRRSFDELLEISSSRWISAMEWNYETSPSPIRRFDEFFIYSTVSSKEGTSYLDQLTAWIFFSYNY